MRDDTISRAAAVKTVKKHYRVDNDLLGVIAYEIEALPPAQPGWIPCNSEHLEDYELPKQHERVLVSFVDRRNRKHSEKPVIRIGINSVEKNYGKPFWRYGNGFSVVAWMPLPTPYREGGQDDSIRTE